MPREQAWILIGGCFRADAGPQSKIMDHSVWCDFVGVNLLMKPSTGGWP